LQQIVEASRQVTEQFTDGDRRAAAADHGGVDVEEVVGDRVLRFLQRTDQEAGYLAAGWFDLGQNKLRLARLCGANSGNHAQKREGRTPREATGEHGDQVRLWRGSRDTSQSTMRISRLTRQMTEVRLAQRAVF